MSQSQLNLCSADQALQDLQWCLRAPQILRNDPALSTSQLGNTARPNLLELKNSRLQLQQFLSEQIATRRLGHYYEYLWAFIVERLQGEKLLARDRQIIDHGCTLGALDLLSFDQNRNCYRHRELAVKFYLAADTGDQLHHWVGPNGRDRLDLKLGRLINHQLPLALSAQGRQHIADWAKTMKLPSPADCQWHSQIIMQGYLFTPAPSAHKNQNTFHHFINPAHQQGHWYHASQFKQLIEKESAREIDYNQGWSLLHRLQWLAPAKIFSPRKLQQPNLNLAFKTVMTTAELRLCVAQHFSKSRAAPLLIAALARTPWGWEEKRRLFVIDDDWPYIAALTTKPSRSK